jgi:hypothetical protein
VSSAGLGASIPEQDESALVEALELLLYDKTAITKARLNVDRERAAFFWDNALAPLVEFCRNPIRAADKRPLKKKSDVHHLDLPTGTGLPVRRKQRTGIRRDIGRVAYYLRNGGVGAVVERFQARRQRMKDSART